MADSVFCTRQKRRGRDSLCGPPAACRTRVKNASHSCVFESLKVCTAQARTERAGFEPAVLSKEHTGFRNRLDQPLRHLSGNKFKNKNAKIKIAEADSIHFIYSAGGKCKGNNFGN